MKGYSIFPKISELELSDGLMLFVRVGTYPSALTQSVYSTASADWADTKQVHLCGHICKHKHGWMSVTWYVNMNLKSIVSFRCIILNMILNIWYMWLTLSLADIIFYPCRMEISFSENLQGKDYVQTSQFIYIYIYIYIYISQSVNRNKGRPEGSLFNSSYIEG